MTENNNLNKSKYFREYGYFIVEDKIQDYVLELYDVQTISERECNKVFRQSKLWVIENFTNEEVVKELRKLDYATPYKELCVQTIINYGWIRKKMTANGQRLCEGADFMH